MDPESLEGLKEVVVAKSVFAESIENEKKIIEAMPDSKEKEAAGFSLTIRKAIYETIPEVNHAVKSVSDLKMPDIRDMVVAKVRETLFYAPQQNLFAKEIIKDIEAAYDVTMNEFIRNTIEIPRIVIQPTNDVDAGFHDFNLDVKNLNYQPVSEEIMVQFLARKENNIHTVIGKYGISADKPENLIINELINNPEIDYDLQSDLLFKLVGAATTKLKSYLNDEDFINVVKFHKKEIAELIYSQMRPHFYCNTKSYEEPIVKPFTKIEEHNLTKIQADAVHHYTDTIKPTSSIHQKVFSGFRKACHNMYKFDRKNEKDFAAILENDMSVTKWLRPAPKQFKIYWDHVRQYEPDFVAETDNAIYLVEIKMEKDIDNREVQEKAKAALQFCNHATEYNHKNGGKQWKYLLIPHDEVLPNMSFSYLAVRREFWG